VSKVILDCFVPGTPQPGGSKRGFVHNRTGAVVLVDANRKAVDWKRTVAVFVAEKYRGEPVAGPLGCEVTFYRARPAAHYGTGRNAERVKDSAPRFPVTKPDALMLMRSTEDALTGVVWRDDAQVVTETIRKRYGSSPGARIVVKHQPMDEHEKETSHEQRESAGT
jgi:Holliday junction resolvase RusA-like endonuclease